MIACLPSTLLAAQSQRLSLGLAPVPRTVLPCARLRRYSMYLHMPLCLCNYVYVSYPNQQENV